MGGTFYGFAVDISIGQPRAHMGAKAVRRIDPAVDNKKRDGTPGGLDWLRQFGIQIVFGQDIVPFRLVGALLRDCHRPTLRRCRFEPIAPGVRHLIPHRSNVTATNIRKMFDQQAVQFGDGMERHQGNRMMGTCSTTALSD